MEMLRITTKEVKIALINIAEQSNRPHFGMLVVREVLHAINSNNPHHLKNTVLQEIYVLYGNQYKTFNPLSETEKEILFMKIKKVKSYYAGQKTLVRYAGVNERTIMLILNGRTELTRKVYHKINLVIDDVLIDVERHHSEKIRQSHGKYVTYRKGCRCDPCRIAWRVYIKGKDQAKKLKALEEKGNLMACGT